MKVLNCVKSLMRPDLSWICSRCLSSYKIALTDDKSTYVSWHPAAKEEDFPYECTKPIPEEKHEDEGVLKTQLTPAVKEIFNKKTSDQARQELMDITFTTKHKWFPKNRRRGKKLTMDREYL